jgi:hypothetical protein
MPKLETFILKAMAGDGFGPVVVGFTILKQVAVLMPAIPFILSEMS